MMRSRFGVGLAGVLLTLGQLAGGVSDAGANEKFLDEAGRVIYTIDDDGMVSMFENSPTDLTLSVTRGTREKMQPRITSVSPAAIPAGATTVLTLKGDNLVGATVQMSLPGIDVKPYAGKPKSLEIPLSVRGHASPGEVTAEVTTPIGRTHTSFQIREVQIGGGRPTQQDGEKRTTISVAAPATCPPGMVGVAAERGGFCIEIAQTFSGDARKAEKACAGSGKRLCSASEWRIACEGAAAGTVPVQKMVGDWEWTGTQVIKELPGAPAEYGAAGELNAVLMGQSDCKTSRDYPTWRRETIAGRCCK